MTYILKGNDTNFLAAPNWRGTIADLITADVEVDFNQGLDIRLVTDEIAWCLRNLRIKQLRFAFDHINYEASVRSGIETLTRAGFRSRCLSFYVLIGYDGDETVLERMKILQSYNVDVYPMLYRDAVGKEPQRKLLAVGEDTMWHGSRRNINKFLRIVGRLPE